MEGLFTHVTYRSVATDRDCIETILENMDENQESMSADLVENREKLLLPTMVSSQLKLKAD
jgi:hypothetical protein